MRNDTGKDYRNNAAAIRKVRDVVSKVSDRDSGSDLDNVLFGFEFSIENIEEKD